MYYLKIISVKTNSLSNIFIFIRHTEWFWLRFILNFIQFIEGISLVGVGISI